jgi:hypothetical protein
MSLLPGDASFHEKVEACFVAFRQRGVALSATDLELLDGWAQTGAPFEIIARGIRLAAEQALFHAVPGEFPMHSLKQCKRAVSAQVNAYLKRSPAGLPPAPSNQQELDPSPSKKAPVPFYLHLFESLCRDLEKHSARAPEIFGLARTRLQIPRSLEQAIAQEELTLLRMLRALPFPERLEALQGSARAVREMALSSSEARRRAKRFHRLAFVKLRFQFRMGTA